jgi:hypothetical protein
MKILALLLCVLSLSGCVLKSDIAPAGPNKWMVSARSSARPNDVEPEALKKADAFCAPRHVQPLSKEDNQTFNGWVPHVVTLTFTCVE